MNSIQNLLIPIILILVLIHLFFFKNKIANRVLFILLFINSLVFVIFPELSDHVAHFLGVERGTDLILYLTIIIFYAVSIFLYSKFKKLEIKQTEMIRKSAIEKAIPSATHSKNSKD